MLFLRHFRIFSLPRSWALEHFVQGGIELREFVYLCLPLLFQSGLATSSSRDCHSCRPAEIICPSGRIEVNPNSSPSASHNGKTLHHLTNLWFALGFSFGHVPRRTSLKSFLSFSPLQGFWSLLNCMACCLGLCQQGQCHPLDSTWTGSPRAMSWLCGVDALPSLTFPLVYLLGSSSALFKMDLSTWGSGLYVMLQLRFCHPGRCKPVPCIFSLCTYPTWSLNSQEAKRSQ